MSPTPPFQSQPISTTLEHNDARTMVAVREMVMYTLYSFLPMSGPFSHRVFGIMEGFDEADVLYLVSRRRVGNHHALIQQPKDVDMHISPSGSVETDRRLCMCISLMLHKLRCIYYERATSRLLSRPNKDNRHVDSNCFNRLRV
jgi:hypothetical protein